MAQTSGKEVETFNCVPCAKPKRDCLEERGVTAREIREAKDGNVRIRWIAGQLFVGTCEVDQPPEELLSVHPPQLGVQRT